MLTMNDWKMGFSLLGAQIPGVNGVIMTLGDQVGLSAESPNDAVKQYNVCISTWSLRHLTSAEEYPDEEYLDTSKSSSLKDRGRQQLQLQKTGPSKEESNGTGCNILSECLMCSRVKLLDWLVKAGKGFIHILK